MGRKPASERESNKLRGESSEGAKIKLLSGDAQKEGEAVRLIAFYLPQFHPIPENDQWWGRGFTEWSHVTTSLPLFPGHYQPQLPSDFGFYDLRLDETRRAQAELAKRYGLYGFCYHYYWFSGRTILERPLTDVLAGGKPDFPFCICWANEPWSRRWDGSETEVLLAQEHDPEIDKKFIEDLLPYIKDPRYILVNGAPLIVIYRVALIPEPLLLFEHWRSVAKAAGFPDLHICMAETFGAADPYEFGFDAAVEFPPHGVTASPINSSVEGLPADFKGTVYDYDDVVKREINRDPVPYLRYRTVMPAWDNTARRGKNGNIFFGANPSSYEVWLSDAVAKAKLDPEPDRRIVFINAWNEWGEGAHLEPDRRFGHAYLAATQRALTNQSDWRVLLARLRQRDQLSMTEIKALADSLEGRLQRYEMTNRYLVDQLIPLDEQGESLQLAAVDLTIGRNVNKETSGYVEQVNRFQNGREHLVSRTQGLFVGGWCLAESMQIDDDTFTYLTLMSVTGSHIYSIGTLKKEPRTDVIEFFGKQGTLISKLSINCGFKIRARLDDVEPGIYEIAIDRIKNDQVYRYMSDRRLTVG